MFWHRCGNTVAHHHVNIKSLHQKTNCWRKVWCPPALLHRQYSWQSLERKITLFSVIQYAQFFLLITHAQKPFIKLKPTISGYSLSWAWSSLGMYSFSFWCHQAWQTHWLYGRRSSRERHFTDVFGYCVKACNTVTTFLSSVEVQDIPRRPLFTTFTVSSASNLSCNCYTC
jgi:hypothetical protein